MPAPQQSLIQGKFVNACINENINIFPIPGSSAVTAASVSGLKIFFMVFSRKNE